MRRSALMRCAWMRPAWSSTPRSREQHRSGSYDVAVRLTSRGSRGRRSLSVPAIAHHEPLERRTPVGAVLAVGPAERDDRGALDVVRNAEEFVDASLAAPVQRRE